MTKSSENVSIGGVSAAAVREFLLQSAELPSWTLDYLRKTMSLDTKTARGVATALQMVGYIKPLRSGSDEWQNTDEGNMVAKVSRARPITRKTAEKALELFLFRVNEVNSGPEFLYTVDKAVLFGPYLDAKQKIKDIDLAIHLSPKIKDKRKLDAAIDAQASDAEAAGKNFQSYAAKRRWAETKVRQHLKGRSRAIALYDLNESVTSQPHKVVFER